MKFKDAMENTKDFIREFRDGEYSFHVFIICIAGLFLHMFFLPLELDESVPKLVIPNFWWICAISLLVLTELIFWLFNFDALSDGTGTWLQETLISKVFSLIFALLIISGGLGYYRAILYIIQIFTMDLVIAFLHYVIWGLLLILAVIIYIWLNGFKYRRGNKK